MESRDVRLAATIILGRARAHGWEVYMTRRSARSAFAPDAFVFPGGTVDEQDRTSRMRERTIGLEPQRLAEQFRASLSPLLPSGESSIDLDDAAALCVAALRELFEEAGMLIAQTREGTPVAAQAVWSDDVQDDRIRVHRNELPFAGMLEDRDWFADARALTLFSHWITPPSEGRRYNTHFFFAPGPPDQAGSADAHETHDGIWITPSDALERYEQRQFHLVYPTIKHLERLAPFATLDDVRTFARRKPIVTIMPATTQDDGFEMPSELEHAW